MPHKLIKIGDKFMSTAVLSNGTSYYIPQSDLSFFTELAERMKWKIVSKVKKANKTAKLNQAMALMDTMMVKGGTPVPADADGLDIMAEEKYSL